MWAPVLQRAQYREAVRAPERSLCLATMDVADATGELVWGETVVLITDGVLDSG